VSCRERSSLISTQTGKPIKTTTPTDPAGFGLGVQQARNPTLGTVWAYLGSTLGYRFLVIYLPHSGSTIAIGVNSLPEHDNLGQLANSVYATLHKAGLG
jgi:D-alanyl-D-alanine carboxypeptidase